MPPRDRQGSRVRPYLGNLLGKWAVPVGGVRVDDAEDGIQVGHRVDRKLWKISEEVVLVDDVDGWDTGIGWLGAVVGEEPT